MLTDVGSAGASPAVWHPIASGATPIGFEPDERTPDPSFGRGFAHAILINRVVMPDDDSDTAEFILTEYPSCSSMLEPDLEALGSFVFRDYFEPVKRVEAPTTSLNRTIADHNLPGIQWLKIDSQGADLRILKGLSQLNLHRELAVDIEPGLIDAYKQEDLFPECHNRLKGQGFWMAEFLCQAYAKVRPETIAQLEGRGYDRESPLAKLQKSPTCVEGRYLRDVWWLERSSVGKGLWLTAMIFGICSRQLGCVFDLIGAYGEHFDRDPALNLVETMATDLLRETVI